MAEGQPVDLSSLTTVIVNWNQSDHTIRCVKRLTDDGVPAARIVVVDNGSSDGSWSRLAGSLRSCHLVRVGENLGFSRGNNIGARVLPGSGYLLVNSDAFVHRPGSVAELVRALDRSDVGVVVPRLLNDDLSLQPSVVPVPTPAVALLRASGLSRLVPNRWQPACSVYWDHGRGREIQAAIGAVVLVRGETWDRLGGFREMSFMYAEDLDLCWRAREHGWRVWFAPEAEFVHLGSASARTRWDERARAERAGRAEAAMIREHLSPTKASLVLAFLRAGFAARLVYRRLTGNTPEAAECAGLLRGYGARTEHGDGESPPASAEIAVLPPETGSQA